MREYQPMDIFQSALLEIQARTTKSIPPSERQQIYCSISMSLAGQVEQKRLGLPRNVPAAVQQWEGLIAINYAARAAGITRHMRVHEARALCPELKLMHVETIGESCSFRSACIKISSAQQRQMRGQPSVFA